MKHIEPRRRQQQKTAPAAEPPKGNVVATPAPGRTAVRAGNSGAVISPEERRGMIELAAYYRAERRGFTGGSAEEDWLEAEADIDRALAGPTH